MAQPTYFDRLSRRKAPKAPNNPPLDIQAIGNKLEDDVAKGVRGSKTALQLWKERHPGLMTQQKLPLKGLKAMGTALGPIGRGAQAASFIGDALKDEANPKLNRMEKIQRFLLNQAGVNPDGDMI